MYCVIEKKLPPFRLDRPSWPKRIKELDLLMKTFRPATIGKAGLPF